VVARFLGVRNPLGLAVMKGRKASTEVRFQVVRVMVGAVELALPHHHPRVVWFVLSGVLEERIPTSIRMINEIYFFSDAIVGV
jgi:hypothetical protein